MFLSFTRNHGRRYTYYASNINDDHGAPALRLPAGELELSVRTAIARWTETPATLVELAARLVANDKQRFFDVCSRVAQTVTGAPVGEARQRLSRLGTMLAVSSHQASIEFDAAPLLAEAGLPNQPRKVELVIPTTHETYGHEARLRLEPPAGAVTASDRALVELVGRSIAARDELLAHTDANVRTMPITRLRHLQRTARLSYLDPAIIRSILGGTQPKRLLARELWRMADLPLDWEEQRTMLGVSAN